MKARQNNAVIKQVTQVHLLKEDFALLLSVDIDYQCHNKTLAELYGTVCDGKHVQLTSFLS